MEKGNVLVIGNSGVGKSTLINAVLGESLAETSCGAEGTTKELKIYENTELPFRLIDTAGFEPSWLKEFQAIQAVKKWSKESIDDKKSDNKISAIWFCIDGTSRKLFGKTISNLSKATKMWESVPIIVVITKSYSVPERKENIQMVEDAFAGQKDVKNLKGIIPLVAATYVLNDAAYAAPEGITELIDKTNEILPEGIRAAEHDIYSYKLKRKNVMAQSVIGTATTAGIIVGAVPIPFADAMILTPTEVVEVNALGVVYEIGKDEKSKRFINSIIEVGTVGAAAKASISAIKAIPGINIAASVLNAVIAGVFVATIGETSKYLFEQVYTGNRTLDDIDWAQKILASKLTNEALEKVTKILSSVSDKADVKEIAELVKKLFTGT